MAMGAADPCCKVPLAVGANLRLSLSEPAGAAVLFDRSTFDATAAPYDQHVQEGRSLLETDRGSCGAASGPGAPLSLEIRNRGRCDRPGFWG